MGVDPLLPECHGTSSGSWMESWIICGVLLGRNQCRIKVGAIDAAALGPLLTRSQAVARIADRTAKNYRGHMT